MKRLILAGLLAVAGGAQAMADPPFPTSETALFKLIDGEWEHRELDLSLKVKDGAVTVTRVATAPNYVERLGLEVGRVMFRPGKLVPDGKESDRTYLNGECWDDYGKGFAWQRCRMMVTRNKGELRLLLPGLQLIRKADMDEAERAARR